MDSFAVAPAYPAQRRTTAAGRRLGWKRESAHRDGNADMFGPIQVLETIGQQPPLRDQDKHRNRRNAPGRVHQTRTILTTDSKSNTHGVVAHLNCPRCRLSIDFTGSQSPATHAARDPR